MVSCRGVSWLCDIFGCTLAPHFTICTDSAVLEPMFWTKSIKIFSSTVFERYVAIMSKGVPRWHSGHRTKTSHIHAFLRSTSSNYHRLDRLPILSFFFYFDAILEEQPVLMQMHILECIDSRNYYSCSYYKNLYSY